jgi:hypothetical protein
MPGCCGYQDCAGNPDILQDCRRHCLQIGRLCKFYPPLPPTLVKKAVGSDTLDAAEGEVQNMLEARS